MYICHFQETNFLPYPDIDLCAILHYVDVTILNEAKLLIVEIWNNTNNQNSIKEIPTVRTPTSILYEDTWPDIRAKKTSSVVMMVHDNVIISDNLEESPPVDPPLYTNIVVTVHSLRAT